MEVSEKASIQIVKIRHMIYYCKKKLHSVSCIMKLLGSRGLNLINSVKLAKIALEPPSPQTKILFLPDAPLQNLLDCHIHSISLNE